MIQSIFFIPVMIASFVYHDRAAIKKLAATHYREIPLPPETRQNIVVSAPIKACIQLFSYIVKSGDTFAGILRRFNIPSDQVNALYSNLTTVGFSKLFPGDSVVISQDTLNNLKSFSILSRFQDWYHIHLQDDKTVQVKREPLETTKVLCVVKGTLHNSLSEDMATMNISDALVVKIADIFAWDINFFTDPQQGDSFSLLFEKIYKEGKCVEYGDVLAAKYASKRKPFYAFGIKDIHGKMQYFNEKGYSLQKPFLRAPLQYNHISSRFSFNRLHPVFRKRRPHLGVDYAAPRGTPVWAASNGTVTFAGYNKGFGKQVIISHGKGIVTYYGHLQSIYPYIKHGASVSQGQRIGTVGATGIATGPHLDYRISINNRFVNPISMPFAKTEGTMTQNKELLAAAKAFGLFQIERRALPAPGCYVVDVQEQKTSNGTAFVPSPLKNKT